MFYFDPILIDAMARGRLSRSGQLINLDMRDYHMFASEREAVCAVRVRSEEDFSEFITELKTELYNAQSSIDEPAEVMFHLLVHPDAGVTMENYASLNEMMTKLFGDDILIKVGFATDGTLPDNRKDIMVFIAGN